MIVFAEPALVAEIVLLLVCGWISVVVSEFVVTEKARSASVLRLLMLYLVLFGPAAALAWWAVSKGLREASTAKTWGELVLWVLATSAAGSLAITFVRFALPFLPAVNWTCRRCGEGCGEARDLPVKPYCRWCEFDLERQTESGGDDADEVRDLTGGGARGGCPGPC